ncbi:MAG: hypothetical protein P0Y55_10400 [Candidatus Cohnella colombiensis]|uniref:Uncharacterized protein n=1 Tax=Candidatus Cohnella colombiensis TaxID=3121368 RepID=A0AA95EW36_9BACL|nr:MAG: hypothetical protein P0Y55_10400 [Cohnella sp.]
MSLMDALFYWLQMKWVTSTRPDDEAASDTLLFFAQILSENHELISYDVSSVEGGKVYVTYTTKDGAGRTVWFDQEAVEQLNREMFGVGEEAAFDELDAEDEEEAERQ